MTLVSNVNSAALLILRQAVAVSETSRQKQTATTDLVAVANGLSEKIGASRQPTQAQSKISESMFSVNHVNVNKLKLDLIERAGKALGVDQNDYASREEFVSALKKAVGRLKMEGGQSAVVALEKELGLDKLGVSLDDVINSAKDPDSNDKLTIALEKQAGKTGETSEEADALQSLLKPDEIGLYGPSPNWPPLPS